MSDKKEIALKGKKILVTGCAGFIGANLVQYLLTKEAPSCVIGIDNMNDYYDVSLKEWRLSKCNDAASQSRIPFHFVKGDIANEETVKELFLKEEPDLVVNLAAQAGVRYSIVNPSSYIQSNLVGFYHILEACRHSYDERKKGVEHLVYASSSSVYGANHKVPFSTDDRVDDPVSLYAATKKSDELLSYAYSSLYGIPATGLRYFTVYGPGGRPDMAYFGFTNTLKQGKTIRIFNYGNCSRDFTYIDDIVEGTVRVMKRPPGLESGLEEEKGNKGRTKVSDNPPNAVYNIGGGKPENLLTFIEILEKELVRAHVLPEDYDFEAHKELVPMQPGDVPVTYADTTALEQDFGWKPQVRLEEGLRKFAEWYKEFYSDL